MYRTFTLYQAPCWCVTYRMHLTLTTHLYSYSYEAIWLQRELPSPIFSTARVLPSSQTPHYKFDHWQLEEQLYIKLGVTND